MSVPHSPAELQKLYPKRFAGMREYRDLVWRVLVDEYFARWIPDRAAVLDLGCGHCEFINSVRAETRFVMDLNQSWRPPTTLREQQRVGSPCLEHGRLERQRVGRKNSTSQTGA
jgi:hypothetical protein